MSKTLKIEIFKNSMYVVSQQCDTSAGRLQITAARSESVHSDFITHLTRSKCGRRKLKSGHGSTKKLYRYFLFQFHIYTHAIAVYWSQHTCTALLIYTHAIASVLESTHAHIEARVSHTLCVCLYREFLATLVLPTSLFLESILMLASKWVPPWKQTNQRMKGSAHLSLWILLYLCRVPVSLQYSLVSRPHLVFHFLRIGVIYILRSKESAHPGHLGHFFNLVK